MAFKQVEKKKMSKIMIVGIVVVVLLLGSVFGYMGWWQYILSQQTNEQTQNKQETQTIVDERSDNQKNLELVNDTNVENFWDLVKNAKWTDSVSQATCSFSEDENKFTETSIKNNQTNDVVFVVCKMDMKTTQNQNSGTNTETYSAYCMDNHDKFFNMSLIVEKNNSQQNKTVLSMFLTSEKFSIGKSYLKSDLSDKFEIVGIDDKKFEEFKIDKTIVQDAVKTFCSESLPTATEVDFSAGTISVPMNQEYMLISAKTNVTSSQKLYVLYYYKDKKATVTTQIATSGL